MTFYAKILGMVLELENVSVTEEVKNGGEQE